ncbi:HAMP domain-containing sensor histidine kinase [Malikia sp.]|uniref:sensor histidine kinase n=1 Tax=Malikia sp. TaxID=2070706 RepID=UPI002614F2D9|nr:HAMP domain-containing sensor histidine kinase [Malikia sp.]MDD2730151.1 HAMP domain-containing sensor histidine kinase [Malikia sp.]
MPRFKTAGLPSIRWRITRTLLLISLLWALLVAGVVRYVVHHEVDELMDQGLRESAEVLHSVLAVLHRQGQDQQIAQTHGEYEEHLVWQIIQLQTGEVVSQSHKAPVQALLPTPDPQPRNTADGLWRVMTFSFQGDPQHFLLVAQSEEERVEARTEAATYTLIGALLMSVLATALLSLLVRRELGPLSSLSRAVAGYDPLRPETLPQLPERAELVPMAQAIRDLGGRLAQRIASERAFTAHAAHALRTPLAGIDAQLAIALKEAPESLRPRLTRSRAAAARLNRVMQALLTMFRSGSEPQRQTVRVSELLTPLAFGELRIEMASDAPVDADPDLLSAVLFNLLDNAQRHQARTVWLTVGNEAGSNRLRLQDDGQGCAASQLQQLRDALARQDYGSGSGLKGLGLILADLVVRAHGGQIQLPSVAPGFCVELSWPAAVAPDSA